MIKVVNATIVIQHYVLGNSAALPQELFLMSDINGDLLQIHERERKATLKK